MRPLTGVSFFQIIGLAGRLCLINFFLLGALLLPGSLAAQGVLFPNGGGVPGEIAPFLAGAQGALASGPEAVGVSRHIRSGSGSTNADRVSTTSS